MALQEPSGRMIEGERLFVCVCVNSPWFFPSLLVLVGANALCLKGNLKLCAAACFVFDWEIRFGFVNLGQVLRIPTVFLTCLFSQASSAALGLVFWPCLGLVSLSGVAQELVLLGTFALLIAIHRGYLN